MPQPAVAIIIVNWNGRDDTNECLQSLQKISYPNYSILLVDNGSSDGSVAFFRKRYPGVEIIENKENLGFTGGNNAGMKKALNENFDYILLLNNDTVIHEVDFLSKMVKACGGDSKIGMACPTIFYDDPRGRVWYAGGWLNLWRGWGHYHKISESGACQPTGYTTGCCLLVKKETVNEIGLLNDAYFLSVEDVEWSMRAKQQGWKTVYVPGASIIHKDSQSSRSKTAGAYSPTRIYCESRNSLWFIREYANLFQKVFIWPAIFLLKFLFRATGYILLGRWKKLAALSHGIKDGLFSAKRNFKKP